MSRSVENSPRNLGEIFFQRVEQLGERAFIKLERNRRFEEISWREFGSQVRRTVAGLYALGLKRGERVALLSENRLEWLFTDAATLAAGFPNVVISPKLSDASLLKILSHSQSRAVFVENETGAGRLLNLKGQLPSLEHLIVMDGLHSSLPLCLSFAELLQRGKGGEEADFRAILESVHPDDLATIMYTSGSTGEPKGVMRTQGNILSDITAGGNIALSAPEDLSVVVLSLNHLLGRFGFHKGLVTGRTTAVVELTEQEVDLRVIQALSPTAMTLVPRVMEKLWEKLLAEGKNKSGWKKLEALDELKRGRGSLAPEEERQYEELRASLKGSVRQQLGGRIKYITYSGAPMPPRIMLFFRLIGFPLLGSYGSTECGGVTLSGIGETRPGNLGKPFSHVEVRIADDGEILVCGPSVTPGYFAAPEMTREVLEPDGWFHTGDLGRIEPDGSLRLVGRKKDVFYCSEGSNIYPGPIEILLENEPFVRQAILLGDRRPFLAALVVPDRERMAGELKKPSLSDEEMEEILWSRLEKINENLDHFARIRKIVLLCEAVPEKVRSVTAFQKIKIDRKAVENLYRNEIEKIYQER